MYDCCFSHQGLVVFGLQYGESSTQNLSSVIAFSGRVSGQGHGAQGDDIRVSEGKQKGNASGNPAGHRWMDLALLTRCHMASFWRPTG